MPLPIRPSPINPTFISASSSCLSCPSSPSCLLESGCASGFAAKHRPVLVAFVMAECADEPVADDAAAWKRDADELGRRERELDVFQAELHGEAGLVVRGVDDEFAVDLVGRRREQPFGHHVVEDLWL